MPLQVIDYKGLKVLSTDGVNPLTPASMTGAGGAAIQESIIETADRVTVLEGLDWNTVLSGEGAPDVGEGNDGDFYIDTLVADLYGPKASGVWGSPTSLIGPQGDAGADGKTILNGAGDPTTEGVDGDFYINTTANTLFGPKTGGAWGSGVSLVGPQGDAGADGADGKTVLNGTSDPTTEGVDGDFYINTNTNTLFGPKSGTWPAGVSLVGPQGDAGADGADGADGKTVLNGTSDPTTEGVDGDFYINTTSDTIFGPKTGGAWGSGTSLIGPTGDAGTNGYSVLNGTSDPTTEGVDGDFYINTTSDTIFGPKTGGAWGSGTSLIGPAGPSGGAITFVVDGSGSVITTGVKKKYLYIPFACTITSCTMFADAVGSAVLDIYACAYADAPPDSGDSIVAAAPPTLSSAQKSTDSTLTGWTTSISAGSVMAISVTSAATITELTIVLAITKS